MKTTHPSRQRARPDQPKPSKPPAPESTPLAPVDKVGAVRIVPPAAPHVAFARGFVYAGRGLWYVIRTQRNMRVHLAIGAAALVLGALLHISPVEFAVVVVAIMGVLVTEVINTVIEAVVDLATQEYHALARTAKDVAAGAVLLAAILSVVVGLFIYIPHLWPLLLHLLGR